MGKRLRTEKDVDGELKLLENTLARISQSFTLEKDAALEQGNTGICELRDRVRCYYQPRVRRMVNDLRQLRYLSGRVDGVHTGIFLRMNELEKGLKEARAHFTGTVNRLMRHPGHTTGDDECTE